MSMTAGCERPPLGRFHFISYVPSKILTQVIIDSIFYNIAYGNLAEAFDNRDLVVRMPFLLPLFRRQSYFFETHYRPHICIAFPLLRPVECVCDFLLDLVFECHFCTV